MRQGLSWLLGAVFAFAGCGDRHAGTETGNPEIIVSARFMVYEYTKSRTSHLPFLIMGMGYSSVTQSGAIDSGKCWSRPVGTLANLADPVSRPLPDTVLEDKGPWRHTEIILRAPDEPAGVPVTVDIENWSSPRYAKFVWLSSEGFQKALFEMPQGAEYRLRFGLESSEAWRFEDTIWIPITFDAAKWTDTLASVPGLKRRVDGLNVRYLLFSPDENAAGWNALKAKLPLCFYADSVIVR
jgi:hypothetical protein